MRRMLYCGFEVEEVFNCELVNVEMEIMFRVL